MTERMPLARRVLYALGGAGWQITDRIVVVMAIYFYLPPEGRGLDLQVSQEILWAGLTVFGLASLAGRVFDALADPFVGHASDGSRSPLGRRRSFLVYGILPMAVLPALLFWPPAAPGSIANGLWLAAVMALYFVAFTVYVAPYLALMPEIAWSPSERVDLSTLMAVLALPAALFGTLWVAGFDWGIAAGLTPTAAIRWVVVIGSILAALLCLLPILAVDEERFCHIERSQLSMREAVFETLRNRPFRIYLLAMLPFIVGVNMIQPAGAYYATVILGRSEGFGAQLGLAFFAAMILAFVPVNRLARRAGPKRTIVVCVGLLSVSVSALGLLRADTPGGPHDASNLALLFGSMIATGIAVAGFVVMPNVLIGQAVDYDAWRTGAQRAAMYFGIQGLFTKFLYGVSGAILAFLFARFGNSADEPLGVILVGPVAGLCCLASALLFLLYPEEEVLEATRSMERKDET